MSSSRSRKRKGDDDGTAQSPSPSKKTRRITAYDPAFEQHLADHGVYPEGYDEEEQPQNWDDIHERLMQPRPSLSPSRFTRGEHTKFKRANRGPDSEAGVTRTFFSSMLGDASIPSCTNVELNNLAPLTDGSIVNCTPDYYEGSLPADLTPRWRNDLGPFLVPSTNTSRPCLPNFFTELKGPDGSTAVVERQACYDGAMGARAMRQLRSQVDDKTALDGNTYTITSTYSGGRGGGFLALYTTHPTASKDPERVVDYHMTQLNGWHMAGNSENFRQGVTALRNARDWTQEQRRELIRTANEKTSATPGAQPLTSEQSTKAPLSPSTVEPAQGSNTSVDELAAESSFCQRE